MNQAGLIPASYESNRAGTEQHPFLLALASTACCCLQSRVRPTRAHAEVRLKPRATDPPPAVNGRHPKLRRACRVLSYHGVVQQEQGSRRHSNDPERKLLMDTRAMQINSGSSEHRKPFPPRLGSASGTPASLCNLQPMTRKGSAFASRHAFLFVA